MGAAGRGVLFSVLAAAGIPPAATPPPPFGKGGLRRWVLPGEDCHLQVGWNSYFHSSLRPAPSVCPSGSQLPLKREPAEVGAAREGGAFLCVGCSRNPPGGYAATPLWQGRAAEVGVAGRGLLTRWFGASARVSSQPQPHGARNAAGGRPPTADRRAEGRPPARTGPQASGVGKGRDPSPLSRGTADPPLARATRHRAGRTCIQASGGGREGTLPL